MSSARVVAESVRPATQTRLQRRLAVYVFSYNRAQLLDHSLQTTSICMPNFDVFVVDDNSNDPQTCAVIEKWRKKIPIIPAGRKTGERKTGGLYPNMTQALKHAAKMEYEYALFTQDDMQFVRPFHNNDAILIERYFAKHNNVIQLLVHFMKRPDQKGSISEHWHLDESETAFLRTDLYAHNKACFCAGGIFSVARTMRELGEFAMSEAENSSRLRDKGYYYGYSRYPLISFMPAPISYRGKRRSLEHRFYEKLGGAGFHPVELMTPGEIDAFWGREKSLLPIAEDFLRCPSAPAPNNWAAGGGDYLVIARGGWRKSLYKIISVAKGVIKKLIGRK